MDEIETVTFTAARLPEPHPARNRVIEYLVSAATVTEAGAFTEDLLDPDCPKTVPVGFATDGTLVWELALLHYLRRYETLEIPQQLLDASQDGGACPPVSEARLAAIRKHIFHHGT